MSYSDSNFAFVLEVDWDGEVVFSWLAGTVIPSIITSVRVKVLTPFLLILISPLIFSTPGIVDKLLST